MEMCQELARHSDRIPWRPAWKDRSGNLKKTGEIRADATAGNSVRIQRVNRVGALYGAPELALA
jgi:hypothetical protein